MFPLYTEWWGISRESRLVYIQEDSTCMLFLHLQDLQQHFIYCHILPHHQGKALLCLIQKVKKTSYIRIFSRRTPGSEISIFIIIILFIQQYDDLLLRFHRLDTKLPGSLFCPLHKSLFHKIMQKLFRLTVIVGIHHHNMRIPSETSFFRQMYHVLNKRRQFRIGTDPVCQMEFLNSRQLSQSLHNTSIQLLR